MDIQFGTGAWPGYEAMLLLHAPSRMVVRAGSMVPPTRGATMIAALIENGVVQIMGCESRWIRLAREYGLPEEAIRISVTADNSGSALQLTRAGLGPCLVQDYYTRPAVDLGGLALLR